MGHIEYNAAVKINFMNVDDIEDSETWLWPYYEIFLNNGNKPSFNK